MSWIEEGEEAELSYIEFRQLTQDFSLRIPDDDVPKLDGLPGPSLLTCSNRHGLLFFPLLFGFGWAKLSSLADGSNKLDYGKFEMEDARTSVLKVGGKDEKWLLVGNGLALHIFDLDTFAADPVSYEPKRIKTESRASQIIFGNRVLALAGNKIIEVDCENGCIFDTGLEAKLLSFDEKTGKVMIVTESDEIVIIGAGLSAEKRFKKPEELESSEIKSLFCMNEWDVVVSVEPKDKSKPFLDLYHIDLSSSDPVWVQYFDPTRPRKKAPSTIMMTKLGVWDYNLQELVFIGNAVSADIGTMGRMSGSVEISTFYLSTEEFLPQLPVSVASSRDDQYPIGMALDFTNPELTASSPELPPYPASPILWILTNEGFLCPYRVIKNDTRTPYPGMVLKSPMEFPNVLKKRSTSRSVVPHVVTPGEDVSEEPTNTTTHVVEETLDIADVASGFTRGDYGKYTNALISEFLAIRDMVQTDISQIKGALARSGDLVSGVRRKTAKSIRHLERDTLKLAQECDNPAFLELFKMENDLNRMACDTKSYQVNAISLRAYTSKLVEHSKALQQYRETLIRTVDSLDAKVRVLVAAKTASEEEVSVEQLGERADRLKGEVVELEQSLSLLKLSNSRGKTNVPAVVKPNQSQLAQFAAKLVKRDPKQCLSIYKPEEPPTIAAQKESSKSVDPRFYSCVFPVYDEDQFVSEPEELSPQLRLGSSAEDTSHLDEFDYEEPESLKVGEEEAQNVEDEVKRVEAELIPLVIEPEDLELGDSFDTVIDEHSVEPEAEEEEVWDMPEMPALQSVIATELVPLVKDTSEGLLALEVTESPAKEAVSEVEVKTEEVPKPVNLEGAVPAEEIQETDQKAEEQIEVPSEKKIEEAVTVEEPVIETVIDASDKLEDLLSPAFQEEPVEVREAETKDEALVETPRETTTEPEFVVVESASETPESKSIEVQQEREPVHECEEVPEPQVEPVETEDFSIMDMSMGSLDQSTQPQPNPFGLGSLSFSEPARPKEPVSANSIFGVPTSISSAPTPGTTNQQSSSGGFFKAPILGGFAPKTEESIFGKAATFGQSSSSSFGQSSGFGQASSFGQASFSQSSAFGQTTSAGQSTSFGQTTFGQSSSFGSFQQPAPASAQSFGQSSFGQSSSFGQPSFGSPSAPVFGSSSAPAFGASSFGQPTFGSPSAPTSQPAKVFGQGSSMAAGVPGFGSLAASASAGTNPFGQPQQPTGTNPFGQPQQPDQQQQQKKNLPSSFTQFRA